MPNLISVTQTGTAPDFLVDRTRDVAGNLVKGRFAGAILKHPALMPLADLIFPQSVSDGTLTEVIKKHGYEAAPSLVFTDSPETYKYKKDATSGLLQIDPAVQRAMDIHKSQMDAGISGTFVPVQY